MRCARHPAQRFGAIKSEIIAGGGDDESRSTRGVSIPVLRDALDAGIRQQLGESKNLNVLDMGLTHQKPEGDMIFCVDPQVWRYSVTADLALQSSSRRIPPNPDVAGIGVRVSVYIQVLILLAVQIMSVILAIEEFPMEGIKKNFEVVTSQWFPNSVLGYSLIVSAIIEEKTIALTVYHVILILNLNWLNIMGFIGSLSFLKLLIMRNFTENEIPELIPTRRLESRERLRAQGIPDYEPQQRSKPTLPTAAMKIFEDLDGFDKATPECPAITVQSILGHDLLVSSRSYMVASIVFSAGELVPPFNMFVLIPLIGTLLFVFFMALSFMAFLSRALCMTNRPKAAQSTIFLLIAIVLTNLTWATVFVASIETTISNNDV
ncbi:hypothetical protein M422DRAFT_253648 [Sphaerobolus stellatus SS14]|uniref:Uncharacterized protein n=1 Tax=Sphaerobolus stellatus (strain SS14) TaxID=990650 RepID=A0A0C9V7Z5_SPHS4|nr:hypothetical protein M422DRAFT_253648 [Sphaerobolus stellatus SS14]